ncbi:DNA pilot protein [Microviridae sp.]|nr:DNA pilot protein [Microviridae sp.]
MFGSVLSSIGSGLLGAAGSEFSAKQNYRYDKKTAQQSPSWHVSGLRKAGLNPILAAGGSPTLGSGHSNVQPPSISSSAKDLSGSRLATSQKNLVREQQTTAKKLGDLYDKQAEKAHWEASSASVQAFKDSLLSKAYDNPLVQKTAPFLRAYSESGLPASSAFKLIKSR